MPRPPLLDTIAKYQRSQNAQKPGRKFKNFLKFHAIIIFFVILFFHIKLDIRKQHQMVYKAKIFVNHQINNLFNKLNTSSASLLHFEAEKTTSELKDQPVSSIQINTVEYRKEGNKSFIRLSNKDNDLIDYETMVIVKMEIYKDRYKRLSEDKKDVFINGVLKSIKIEKDP